MKYRQNEWDGEFETYDEWARFGPQPPYRRRPFSMLKVDVAFLSKISRVHARMGHSR
jgi:hypothetical protein